MGPQSLSVELSCPWCISIFCIYIHGGGACVSSFPQFEQSPPSTSVKKTKAARLRRLSILIPLLLSINLRTSAHQFQQTIARPSITAMNTTSLLLAGRPAAGLTITLTNPTKPYAQTENTPSSFPFPYFSPATTKTATTTPTPPNTPTSSPALRPKQLRRISSDSTGWYLDADTPSLQDFEARAQTLVKRVEKFANRCATNVVMGLMSPAAVVLIVFNPIMLLLMGFLIFAMMGGRS